MRLLITRGAEDAARTSALLRQRGHEGVLSPVIVFVETAARWPAGVADACVATSEKAFRFMKPSEPPARETRRMLPFFAVGQKTAEAADRCGFAGERIVAPDAAALAGPLTRHKSRRVIYLTGADRKGTIEAALQHAGKQVIVVETYRAIALDYLSQKAADAFVRGEIDGVLHYSRRSTKLFLQQMENTGEDARAIQHFCLSADVAEPLAAVGCEQIHVAGAPDEKALLELVDAPATRAKRPI